MKYLCILLFLVGCNDQVKKSLLPSETDRVEKLTYHKDSRTGLCFVHNVVYSSTTVNSHIFTEVPCTPEVEKLIKK
jgi:hypothetical protein